ncbi:hypothetical protein GUITHDRAFT_97273 [Guillardia theta CCMP2712]|uniref:Mitochondrial carrier protein n=2 Tax=Guillardia theta TaxID=55529 RepID=L1IMX9_GUITC|nr:hypothetical protein GUITHDRAFT_97273 [Guillardia theta CCMP2712]EKX37452.1 hypothetical protein GUITHDRAFT_97273 [Guillardia theta CCMP2712]|mmetsp:Transcript_16305/g.54612  ORF Transcript_16305/g.54612 Transcript_16305/m.54612 type:complete len:295 (+) Transcript_16305:373-1257(+)|eukprot:XP_005824432.1 hypothetical protein GUITHDRAFT_97273 [Guillardia theta CCMP2712]
MHRDGLIDFTAGSVSGLVADGATHPIDTIRTRLWVQGPATGLEYRYRGLWDGFRDIVRKEGINALFKGFGSVALLTPVAHGLYFGSYEWSKMKLQSMTTKSGARVMGETSAHMTAGFLANCVGALIWNPMDVVKQKQQAVVGDLYHGPVDGLVTIWREGGLMQGLMRGYWSGIATYGPFSAIYFMTYERFKLDCMRYKLTSGKLNTAHFIVGGFFAGTVAAIATAPIDLIKTRIQVCDGYRGVVQTATRLVKEEGVGIFTKGLMARVIWVAPGCAITIAVFEDVKILMGGKPSL